jgi:hypothetical protein
MDTFLLRNPLGHFGLLPRTQNAGFVRLQRTGPEGSLQYRSAGYRARAAASDHHAARPEFPGGSEPSRLFVGRQADSKTRGTEQIFRLCLPMAAAGALPLAPLDCIRGYALISGSGLDGVLDGQKACRNDSMPLTQASGVPGQLPPAAVPWAVVVRVLVRFCPWPGVRDRGTMDARPRRQLPRCARAPPSRSPGRHQMAGIRAGSRSDAVAGPAGKECRDEPSAVL